MPVREEACDPNYVDEATHVCACPACSPEIDALLGGRYSAGRAYDAAMPEPPLPDDMDAALDQEAWDAYDKDRRSAIEAAHLLLRAQYPVSWESRGGLPFARLFFSDGTEARFVEAASLASDPPGDMPWYVAISVRQSDEHANQGNSAAAHRCRCRSDGGQACRTLVRGQQLRIDSWGAMAPTDAVRIAAWRAKHPDAPALPAQGQAALDRLLSDASATTDA